MSLVYPMRKGTELRHLIETAHSVWYAVFEDDSTQVTYYHNGERFQGTPEEFMKHHYSAVEPPKDVWKECEILHDGVWKRNPTTDQYIDLVEEDDEEIVLEPRAR